ncbi:putative WD repeat-containing protein C2A9.03 [Hordeum vulgare]|nr:putative WD repeat-containing protein C2A9.03 [Hordeum vulgare]
MGLYDAGLAGVYPEGDEEDDRLADLVRESDYEDDEYVQSIGKASEDTSVMELMKGKDIHGIHWERLTITRDGYRKSRLEGYTNFENMSNFGRL